MHSIRRNGSEGFVLLVALLLLLLLSAMAASLAYVATVETRLQSTDQENTLAYYGAEAAMEKMMADLDSLYVSFQAPTVVQIQGLEAQVNEPTLPGITYPEYDFLADDADNDGAPDTQVRRISAGPNEGMVAQIVPMSINVTARRPSGAEVKMTRRIEVALIPVFQFGIFSDTDLSYFPGPGFDFGGRIHTNGNLFLAAGQPLTFFERITAVQEVIRAELANGLAVLGNASRDDPIMIPTASQGCGPPQPACRDLQETEGSKVGGPTSGDNPGWTSISLTIYDGMILNGDTGANLLTLPFVAPGLRPIEIVRRPAPGENAATLIGQSRLYNKAQIRVLTSDDPNDLQPSDSGGVGIRLANVPPYYDPVGGVFGGPGGAETAFAEASDVNASQEYDGNFVRPPNPPPPVGPRLGTCINASPDCWPLIDGYILIEAKQPNGTYADVTMEILNYGIAREDPNAILKFQTFRDVDVDGDVDNNDQLPFDGTQVTNLADANPAKFYPINMYDTREGEVRDNSLGAGSDSCAVGGVTNIIELDVGNLRQWLLGAGAYAAGTGLQVENLAENGYIFYLSDRRGMLPDPTQGPPRIVGEYGYEDMINPTDVNGVPDGVLDATAAEDVDENGLADVYGAGNLGEGFGVANGDPTIRISCNTTGRKNRVSGARHGLKLVNGTLGNLPSRPDGTGGFTVASENIVYPQGHYNADTATGFNDPGRWAGGLHVPAAIIADAVSFLSRNWQDAQSLRYPTYKSNTVRRGLTTWYRVAVAGGKNRSFPRPGWTGGNSDFGTDGGTHNFLRYLERWSNQDFNYLGSLVSFFYSEYAVGIYKCCSTVYSPPRRNYDFDTDFLDPDHIPPGTPRFRDVVNLGFQQVFSPN